MGVSCQDVLTILSVGEAMHPDPLPAVQDSAVAVTLIELASVASTSQPLTIRTPGHTGQTVLITVAHLSLQSSEDHIPHPDLEPVLGPAHSQPRAVRAPGHVDHAIAVLLQHLALPELHQLRIKLPDDHCGVFTPCGQVPSIW